jgi:hypothetical protein
MVNIPYLHELSLIVSFIPAPRFPPAKTGKAGRSMYATLVEVAGPRERRQEKPVP